MSARRDPRVPVAAVACLALLFAWIAAAMVLADSVRPWPWPAQFLYYGVAGFAWAFPVRWLMLWGARKR